MRGRGEGEKRKEKKTKRGCLFTMVSMGVGFNLAGRQAARSWQEAKV